MCKARRVISHNELLAEVSQQIVLFKAQINSIKKRISGLIEKVRACAFVRPWLQTDDGLLASSLAHLGFPPQTTILQ